MPEVLPLDAILEPAGGGAREPPALLAYRQEFRTVGGLEKGRLALVAALPVGGNEASRVLVTQDVEPAGVERCLEEMASGGLQTAPVVAAVEDVDFQLEKLLERGVLLRERPDAQADLGEGERHRFWRVEDPRLIEEVQRFLRERDAFVIDGLAELRALRRLGGAASAAGGTPEPRGGEPRGGQARCGEPPRALAVLINLFDFGVTLSAAALLVKDLPAFSINDAVLRLDPHFEVKAYAFGGTASLPRALTDFREDLRIRGFTESVIGACFAGVDNFFLLQLREGADRDELFLPDVRAPLKGFDSVLLRRVVLERCLAPGGAALEIGYCWGAEEAVAAVRTGRCRAAFFLNPPNKRKLVQLARAGLRLPPSSARLEPPVRKGLVKMRVAARSAP